MARFFIDRPVFAWVIALAIILAGVLALPKLPVAQYPNIAPPNVSISANYPGASARTVESAVTAIIEREMNGAPGLLYMSSSSDAAGNVSINLSFTQGTSPDLAAVEVQNRLKIVEERLPEVVRRNGIRIEKAAENYMMYLSLSAERGRFDGIDLGDLASSDLIPQLRRVPGVGTAQLFDAEYAMRIWPDADKLTASGLTAGDLSDAVRRYNARITVGEIGSGAVPGSAPINASVTGDDGLTTPEAFGQIPLRADAQGRVVLLRDVARVELGGSDYLYLSRMNGKPATTIGIKLAPGANAVGVAKRVRAVLDQAQAQFPPGVRYEVAYDSSRFVGIAIEQVVKTLLEAVVLVFLVMMLFMQNLRATLIPTLVVPIALLGTFAVMLPMGFSINVLTLFGLVLAIGILVDDAIVVVENVERVMHEEGLSPREATAKAMRQISGAIVGISLVLTAVFVPMAFFGGAVGNIYRQFSLSLAVSMVFSAFLALTLTPALCATLLKPVQADHGAERKGFFGAFNRGFARLTARYRGGVAMLLNRTGRALVAYGAVIGVVVLLFMQLPTAFLPEEDTGEFMTVVMLPTGATQAQTLDVVRQAEQYFMTQEPAVASTLAITGFSLYGNGQNAAMLFLTLKDWKQRKGAGQHVDAVVERANAAFGKIKGAMVMAMNSPALPELGSKPGFDLRLQDRGGAGYERLAQARDHMLAEAAKHPALSEVTFAGQGDAPQVLIDVDRKKALAMGVSIEDINRTLAVMFGSDYAGDFVYRNQVRRVIVQADGKQRVSVEQLGRMHVRNAAGAMVPLSAFTTTKWIVGPLKLDRYNGFPAMTITGSPAPGHSSGEAMAAMESIARGLPAGFGYEWTGQSFEERLSGAQAPALFALSILVVFLCLAALYESWSIPLAVLLVVPLGVLGALLGATLRFLPNDIYFKVGLIATIGLSAKNAILIIEVAKDLVAQGMGLIEATLEAARLRFRPIVMTSLAFAFGVVPLALASGAASASQRAIGTGVLGGIIAATVLAVFLVPVFFVVVRRVFKGSERQRRLDAAHEHETAGPAA
ncbi:MULTISPECIES: efflux RND transporter permease subunit [Ralstonia]|jgi:hydrophobe/amphiphile efflux-1 (HAE1) family protein|uniref:Efflux pump membrane transporter n=3 Tax=Pseudomonadota TaxID=1224 RepID=A0ABN9HXI3_RALPI|nr:MULTISPECIES: efflux RND transporter permease subunit [Ralstonia]MBA4200664.1 multidrug efflux RND transporter permease subunit [Ralstonia sp.]MBA4230284.1 multidrug efflux RND transporter permease subunit [Ralstonia sp.]MBA4236014.1 multidrug efflux RND transporter permease subunit [Ralstonia sp.]MBA4280470.1 multidrug efflux RND transporter permease subunit [Ralstonia sp.]MBA4297954.1 multidrug efflux RND transporter permease subunit [Ralstonia sp.]